MPKSADNVGLWPVVLVNNSTYNNLQAFANLRRYAVATQFTSNMAAVNTIYRITPLLPHLYCNHLFVLYFICSTGVAPTYFKSELRTAWWLRCFCVVLFWRCISATYILHFATCGQPLCYGSSGHGGVTKNAHRRCVKRVLLVYSVRPSSGWWKCFPLSIATDSGSRPGVPLPPMSPLSRICPQRRSGSSPGDVVAPPVLSLRGWGPTALSWPASTGRMREGAFPPLAIPMADEGEFTHVILLTLSAWFMWFVPTAFRPSDVARGFVWDPHIPGRDLNSMLPADTWSTGVRVPKKYPKSRRRTLP